MGEERGGNKGEGSEDGGIGRRSQCWRLHPSYYHSSAGCLYASPGGGSRLFHVSHNRLIASNLPQVPHYVLITTLAINSLYCPNFTCLPQSTLTLSLSHLHSLHLLFLPYLQLHPSSLTPFPHLFHIKITL